MVYSLLLRDHKIDIGKCIETGQTHDEQNNNLHQQYDREDIESLATDTDERLSIPGGHAAPFGQLLDMAYTGLYGVETKLQSALNLVYLLGSQPSTSRLNLAGSAQGRVKIVGGNQQLPAAIAPGISNHYTGHAALSYPTGDPHLLGSYSCWLVGQYTQFAGYERVRQGPIHFAGEHCSVRAQGFMEGGASEGARAAREVLQDYGIDA